MTTCTTTTEWVDAEQADLDPDDLADLDELDGDDDAEGADAEEQVQPTPARGRR